MRQMSLGSVLHSNCLMSQSQPPPTSKTAKKRAGPAPLKVEGTQPTVEGQEDAGEPVPADETGATPPARPTISKRRNRRQFEIPKVSFRRLVQELAAECKSDMRFQHDAYEALQEAAETLVSQQFQRCSQLADLCKLDTVRDEHWRFVQQEGGGQPVPCSGRS